MRVNITKLKFYFLVFLILTSILTSIILHVEGYNFREIIKDIYDYQYFSIIYIFLFLVSSFFPLPFLTFIGAAVFSFWEALIYSVIGNMITVTLTFYLTRLLGRDYVQQFEKKYKKIKDMDTSFAKHGFRDVILLRFFFLIPPEAVSIIAGLSKMKFWDNFLASLLGVIPLSIASILIVQSRMSGSTLLFAISIIIFIALLVLPIIFLARIRKVVESHYHKVYGHSRRLYRRGKNLFNGKHGKK